MPHLYRETLLDISFEKYQPKRVQSLQLVEASPDFLFKYADRKELSRLLEQKGDADEILITRNGLITDTTSATWSSGREIISLPRTAGCSTAPNGSNCFAKAASPKKSITRKNCMNMSRFTLSTPCSISKTPHRFRSTALFIATRNRRNVCGLNVLRITAFFHKKTALPYRENRS